MEIQSNSKHTLLKRTCNRYGEDKEEVGEADRGNNTKFVYLENVIKKNLFSENKEDAVENQTASQTKFTSEDVLLEKKKRHTAAETGDYGFTNQNGSANTNNKVENIVYVSDSIKRIGDKEEVPSNGTVEENRNLTANPRPEPDALKLEKINTKFIQTLVDVLDKNNSDYNDLRTGFEDNNLESSQTIQNLNKQNEVFREQIGKLLEEHLRKQEEIRNRSNRNSEHNCKEFESHIPTLNQHLHGDSIKTMKSSIERQETYQVEANDGELDAGIAGAEVENVVRKRTAEKQDVSSGSTVEGTGNGGGGGGGTRNPRLLKKILYGTIAFLGFSSFAVIVTIIK